jgi:hypothetical protein
MKTIFHVLEVICFAIGTIIFVILGIGSLTSDGSVMMCIIGLGSSLYCLLAGILTARNLYRTITGYRDPTQEELLAELKELRRTLEGE